MQKQHYCIVNGKKIPNLTTYDGILSFPIQRYWCHSENVGKKNALQEQTVGHVMDHWVLHNLGDAPINSLFNFSCHCPQSKTAFRVLINFLSADNTLKIVTALPFIISVLFSFPYLVGLFLV